MDRCCCGFWKIVLSLILSCYLLRPAGAQNYPDTACKEELLKYTEQVYGPDDFIIQGRLYKIRNNGASEHPYFNNSEWKEALIYANENCYQGLTIQYDIEKDIIILQVIHANGKTNFVYSEFTAIDSFKFDDHLFINLQNINDSLAVKGYFEKIFRGDCLYVMKYKKQFVKNFNAIDPKGTYSEQSSLLFIIQDNEIISCPDRKSLLGYFHEHEKAIRNYMKQKHIHFRRAGKDDLAMLCRYINEITKMK